MFKKRFARKVAGALTVAATLAALLPGQAQASEWKNVMVEIGVGDRYCKVVLYVYNKYKASKSVCDNDVDAFPKGWVSMNVKVLNGQMVNADLLSWSHPAFRTDDQWVPTDNLNNFWLRYKGYEH